MTAKKTVITEAYVRVDLGNPENFGIGAYNRADSERKRALQSLAYTIKLRVNRFIDDRGDVSVIIETEEVCVSCGYSWGEDSDTYNGGCCEEDEKRGKDVA